MSDRKPDRTTRDKTKASRTRPRSDDAPKRRRAPKAVTAEAAPPARRRSSKTVTAGAASPPSRRPPKPVTADATAPSSRRPPETAASDATSTAPRPPHGGDAAVDLVTVPKTGRAGAVQTGGLATELRPDDEGPATASVAPEDGTFDTPEDDLDLAIDGEGGLVLDDDDGAAVNEEESVSPPSVRPASSPVAPDVEPMLLAGGGTLVRFDPLGRYLSEVRRYPTLERAEELRLTRAFRQTRDPEAAHRLVTANLILVVKIARLFRRAVVSVLDLIQEGNVGLLHALDRYDPEVGVKFSTYASWWIRAYILKYLLDNTRLVRVGTTNARRKLLYNLNREKRRLEAAGFTAGPKLLAEKFGVSERDVVDVEHALRGGDIALDAPLGDDTATTRGEMLASEDPTIEDQVARRELKELLDAKLGSFRRDLNEKETAILDARLLAEEPATLQEIGDRFGITREAVRQTEKRLTDRLRAFLTAELGEEAVLQFRRR